MKTVLNPTTLGNLKLANHIVRSATYEGMSGTEGEPTAPLFKMYTDLAANQVGLIISGGAFVLPEGKGLPGMLGIHDDSLIEGYKQLTGQVHQYNGKIVLQLIFCGTQGFLDVPDVYSPSAIPDKLTKRTGKEMSAEDILHLKKAFAAAAQRAKNAGFDGVEIHSSAGFLLSQFLTPFYNHRTDQYGGPIENRARLLLEIYEEIREQVGKDFAVLVKINCADFMDEGFSLEDSLYVCERLAAQGIDAIEITGGAAAIREKTSVRTHILTSDQESYFADQAAKISQNCSVPIILNGGNRSLEVMEHWATQTSIAFFGMCRPFLAEPALVKRWYEGNTEKAKCISCNKCSSFSGTECKVFPTI